MDPMSLREMLRPGHAHPYVPGCNRQHLVAFTAGEVTLLAALLSRCLAALTDEDVTPEAASREGQLARHLLGKFREGRTIQRTFRLTDYEIGGLIDLVQFFPLTSEEAALVRMLNQARVRTQRGTS